MDAPLRKKINQTDDDCDSPMNMKNINKPNSLIEAFNVRPKIWSPFEYLDSLNIRKTLTKRITRSIARDVVELS